MRTILSSFSCLSMLLAWCATSTAATIQSHTDYRPGYSGGCSGPACHVINSTKFLPDNLGLSRSPDYSSFCISCHNSAGEAHDRPAGIPSTNLYVNMTGFDLDRASSGVSHSWKGRIGNAGTRAPPAAPYSVFTGYMPGGKVVCQTCHSSMTKDNVENIGFSPTWIPATDQGDHKLYQLGSGATKKYLSQYIRVYRTATAMPTAPENIRTRKKYLVSPADYTYDPSTGMITFTAAQGEPGTVFIYADIGQPYLRAGNADNALCISCHANRNDQSVSHQRGTGVRDSHPVAVDFVHDAGLNDTLKSAPGSDVYIENGQVLCTSCHDPHNAPSGGGRLLRSEEPSALCANCHRVNGFDGVSTALVAVHSGAKHETPTLCLDCHTTHGSTNIMLLRDRIKGKEVLFQGFTGAQSFGMDTGSSPCEVCHTKTTKHKSDGSGSGHNTGSDCTSCHKHAQGFGAAGGGAFPCYDCHAGGSGSAPDIKAMMGLGTSFSWGGKASRHIIAFDNLSGSSCLTMCHVTGHITDSPNLIGGVELPVCSSCHADPERADETTSAGKSIFVAADYAASMHNFSSMLASEVSGFAYSANCTKCHLPHGMDEYPMPRASIDGRATGGNTPELCFACHDGTPATDIESPWDADLANPGHRQIPGGCVKCHDPHGSSNDLWPADPARSGMISNKLGTYTSVNNVCLHCHSGKGVPGESVYDVMTNANGSYGPDFSAASVHDFGLNVAIGGHTVDLTCTGCHDPHNTEHARLLRGEITFSGLSTATIQHVSATIAPQGPITQYLGGWAEYCIVCHTSMAQTGGQSPYRRHPYGMAPGVFPLHTSGSGMETLPLESGTTSCVTCHYTHGSPKSSLLRFQDAATPEKYLCLQCHGKGSYLGGGAGSHGGFLQHEGLCSDCHNMHTLANKLLLNESTETALCVYCHGWTGDPSLSRYKVWLNYTSTAGIDRPSEFWGTGGTFGAQTGTGYQQKGGDAPSMHDINDEATPAPGGVTTQHRCGTCHNPHGSRNYRVLRREVNNITGIDVYARTDQDGGFLAYSTGLVRFCSACHASYKVDDDGQGNWIRHPVGRSLSNYSSESAFYANNTTYRPKIGLETGDTISCVTCHFSHGSLADANLLFPGGRTVNACKTCHDRDSFDAGGPGSHAGFVGNDGSCSDCHSMHSEANAKLLKADAETNLCVACHDNPGTSTNTNASHMDVWKGNVIDFNTYTTTRSDPWMGTGGSFGSYQAADGGNAPSMHPVNSDARIAPGDSATVVHCGTCHDSHGSPNYRLLKASLNGKTGIAVSAQLDAQGHTTAYNGGMSDFCTACHVTYIECGSAAGYTRHPVNVSLTADELVNYQAMDGPDLLPLQAGNQVMCTTCHFAHGSPYAKMMRMDNTAAMCNVCHAKGLDPDAGYEDVAYTHGGFNGNGGDCSACHVMHSGNHRKLLIVSDETALCYSCHGPAGSATVVWAGDSYTPAWNGTGGSFGEYSSSPDHDGGSIYSHHDISGADEQAPGGGTVSKRCGTCHNPHGNNNYRLLRDKVNGVGGIKVRVGVMGNYSSGMDAFCSGCHVTYGLTGSGVGGYRRHPVGKRLNSEQFGHYTSSQLSFVPKPQVEIGRVFCLSCHYAHGSPSYSMLRMQSYTSVESEMCQQCHMKGYKKDDPAGYRQSRNTHGGFNGNRANCGVCHSMHDKNYKKLLVEEYEAKLCDNCHAGIGKFAAFRAEDPDVMVDAPSRFNVFSTIGNSFGNYSVGGGDVVSWHEVDGTHRAPGGVTLELRCGKCHNPHGNDNFAILRETIETTTDIKVFGRLSSTGPFNTYSSGFARFCSACHTRLTSCGTGDPWTRHPVDFELKHTQYLNWSSTEITPRVPLEAGNQVTCITCHDSHGSKNYSLQRQGGNRMCQQCHNR